MGRFRKSSFQVYLLTLVLTNYLYFCYITYCRLLRGEVLSTAIHCENKDAERESTVRFDNWMKKNARVPPNLREVVYSAGLFNS
jgi:hypothetical protein